MLKGGHHSSSVHHQNETGHTLNLRCIMNRFTTTRTLGAPCWEPLLLLAFIMSIQTWECRCNICITKITSKASCLFFFILRAILNFHTKKICVLLMCVIPHSVEQKFQCVHSQKLQPVWVVQRPTVCVHS
jgi:hypothetical protein